MEETSKGTIVVERRFDAVNEKGEEYEILLRVNTPSHDSRPNGDWYCTYTIAGITEYRREGKAFGVDSLQAFLLALNKAHSDLRYIQQTYQFDLTWLGQNDLGIQI